MVKYTQEKPKLANYLSMLLTQKGGILLTRIGLKNPRFIKKRFNDSTRDVSESRDTGSDDGRPDRRRTAG
ncbi:hypothetical protein Bca4012_038732 [Brassica carinata]|uniref:Uncharacterized protein n=1 Tax=Brassica carinata TaxID=52824 RepID=A0A8X7U5Z0_BRACI|nr:hypothetical protein Bca52824_062035 [Brassica carinata]